MRPGREPDFLFLPAEEAEELLAAGWRLERFVRRRPPDYQAEQIVKGSGFRLEQAAEGAHGSSVTRRGKS